MNTTQSTERPTVRVPAAELSDAALNAERIRNVRLSVEELAEVMCGTDLSLSAKEEAAAARSMGRWSRRGR
jgi:hypothetical protein